jgi:hypothetical protein
MSKTKKTILIIFLILISPVILFVDIIIVSIIDELTITQKDIEKYGKKMQPKSGIVFPADTTFVNGYWVENTFFQERGAGWKYTSKEPFQLPENVEVDIFEGDMDMYEDWFSGYFETNITGATEYKKAEWMKNGFVFSASMLETPERYYLRLDSHVPRSYELENPKEYGLPRNIDAN